MTTTTTASDDPRDEQDQTIPGLDIGKLTAGRLRHDPRGGRYVSTDDAPTVVELLERIAGLESRVAAAQVTAIAAEAAAQSALTHAATAMTAANEATAIARGNISR